MNSPPIHLDELAVEPGTPDDLRALERFHYRPGRPATIASILRAAVPVVGGSPPLLAGVLITSFPPLSCAARDRVFPRYAGLPLSPKARLLNGEVRTISRVIVEPRFRALGVASRLVRQAVANSTTPIIEAMASMGRACPVFERAGLRRFDPPLSRDEARVMAAFDRAGIPLHVLASTRLATESIESLDAARRHHVIDELTRLSRRMFDRRRSRSLASPDANQLTTLIARARRRLASRPVYYAATKESLEESLRLGGSPGVERVVRT